MVKLVFSLNMTCYYIFIFIFFCSPCVVGNLWDVTDRDIDRLTEDFLESWLKENDDNDEKKSRENLICTYLNKSRQACKMTHLNGSAPIVYGLPVNFK
jgi:separase